MNIRLLIGTNNLASDGAYMNATGRGKSVVGRYMNHGYAEWAAGGSDTVHSHRVPIADHLRL